MRQGLRFGLAALVPLAALAITMGASGSPKRATPAAVAGATTDLGPSCYPTHEFTIFDWIGAFRASSAGSASGNGGSASWTTSVKVTGNKSNTSGFFANPGSIAGDLSATVHVPGAAHTVHFTSHCISAAALGLGVEVIAEGVVDLQPWSPGDNEAIVTLFVSPRKGLVPQVGIGPAFVSFAIQHAKTCDVLPGQQYNFEFSDTSTALASLNGKFKGSGALVRGRAGLPARVAPKNEPCPGTTYD